MARNRIGLALGSGSARGMSHIGIIESLIEIGLEPAIVCGSSIGALVGAAYVAGRLPELRQWAETATWREVLGLMHVRLSGGGLIDGKNVIAFLRRLGIDAPIEGYAKKFAAVATDLETGREVWLRSGPIDEAVRASITVPGILSPERIDGKWLLDGGLSNPVPVSLCRALGAEVVIAVNLNGDLLSRHRESGSAAPAESMPARAEHEFLGRVLSQLPAALRDQAAQIAQHLMPQEASAPGYFDVLTTSLSIMQEHVTQARLAREPAEVMLVPRLRDFGLMEFGRSKEAIAAGRASVEEALPQLRRYAD